MGYSPWHCKRVGHDLVIKQPQKNKFKYVCVCVCVRARVCVCLCVFIQREGALSVCVYIYGFPGGSNGKETTCYMADLGLIPGVGRSP